MDPWKVIGALTAIVGLVRALMGLVKEIQETLDVLGLGQEKVPTAFYELWFWAFIAAITGGVVWGLCWRRNVGGTGVEPHGIWAILWPILTLLPMFVCLGWLSFKYDLLPWRLQCVSYMVWLAGVIVGSMVFYDCPLKGPYHGIRDCVLNATPVYAEFWLVLIWSALLATPAFLFLAMLQSWLFGIPITVETIWQVVVKPSGWVVIVTSFPVVACLLVYPNLGDARGIVAGLFLRMSLFLALFSASQLSVITAKIH